MLVFVKFYQAAEAIKTLSGSQFEPGSEPVQKIKDSPNPELNFRFGSGHSPDPELNFRFGSGSNPVRIGSEPNFGNTTTESYDQWEEPPK